MERELDSDSTSWADLNFGFKIHNLNISELDELRRIMVVV
jgi:hypothetical protein